MQEFWNTAKQKIKESNAAWKKAKSFRKMATHCEDESGRHLVSALAILQDGATLLGKNLRNSLPLTRDGVIVGVELVFVEGGLERHEYFYDESSNIKEKNTLQLPAASRLGKAIEEEG